MYKVAFFSAKSWQCRLIRVGFGSVLSMVSLPLLAAPVNGVVDTGNGTINYNGALTTVQQNTDHLAINWDSFNIQPGEQVVFVQPGASSIALNRDFSGVPSELFGSLSANGQVFLLNTAGVLIGAGASVNVGGLLISDMAVTNANFEGLADGGPLVLTDQNAAAGGITNAGDITTSTREGVTFIGQFIQNDGIVTANNGNVNLTVADGAVVITDPDGTLGVQMSQGITRDISATGILINNSGEIRANQGNVNVNVQYLSSLNVQAVNNTGLINAVGIGYGEINQNIVLQQLPPGPEDLTPAEDVITDSFGNEPEEPGETLADDEQRKPGSSLNDLMADCSDEDPENADCRKQKAIKHYLGRLLIGGDLPN